MGYNKTPSENLKKMIRKFEGCRTEAYYDVKGWAIAYGNHRYADGKLVQKNDKIDTTKAEELLTASLTTMCASVAKILTNSNITQQQFDSVVSLRYNVGTQLNANSKLIRLINENPTNYDAIGQAFSEWRLSGGKIHPSLVRRRAAEFEHYKTGKLDLSFNYTAQVWENKTDITNETSMITETRYKDTNYCYKISCDFPQPESTGGGGGAPTNDANVGDTVKSGVSGQTNEDGMNILIKAIDEKFKIVNGQFKQQDNAALWKCTWDIQNGSNEKVGTLQVNIAPSGYKMVRVTSVKSVDYMRKKLNNKPDYDPTISQEKFDKIVVMRENTIAEKDKRETRFEKIIYDSGIYNNFTAAYGTKKKSLTKIGQYSVICDKGTNTKKINVFRQGLKNDGECLYICTHLGHVEESDLKTIVINGVTHTVAPTAIFVHSYTGKTLNKDIVYALFKFQLNTNADECRKLIPEP